MVYRGISCMIPNERGNYLYKLLNGVDMEGYRWFIEDAETYVGTGEDLFTQTQYTGDEFKQMISEGMYYVVCARIQGSMFGDDAAVLKTYGDFCASDCQIYVVIIDCTFVDIYVKSQTTAEIIRQNAIKCDFADIAFITEKNDRNLR